VYAQLKDTKASIEKWVTTKIEQVQQTVSLRITSEINRMISLITTTSQKLNNKIERQAKNVNVLYHRVDDMNITDLEEAMLETKITTLKSSLQEEIQSILDQQKEAFNSEMNELKKNLDNTNNRYRYLLQENYELRKEITMLQEKDEPSGNEHVEAVIQQVKDLTEMIYQIKKLQTEHSYKIKDTKSVLGTSMEQAQNATDKVKNFQHMVDSLDKRMSSVHHTTKSCEYQIKVTENNLEELRIFTKNEVKQMLTQQQNWQKQLDEMKNSKKNANPSTPVPNRENTQVKSVNIPTASATATTLASTTAERTPNPYPPRTPKKEYSNPFDMFPSTPTQSKPMSTDKGDKFNPVDLTTAILDHTVNTKPPVLPSYNPKHSFKKWQYMCLLEFSTSKSPYYKSFVTVGENEVTILNPSLTKDQKKDLFALLNKAMKPENLEFIDFSVIARSDGVELWNLCQSRYAPLEKSVYEKKLLERDFEAMKKGNKETYDDFLKRVEAQSSHLATYGIHPTDQDKALTLLKGLKSEKLEAPILSITYQDSNYDIWVKPGNLKHTLKKAKSLMFHKSEIEKSIASPKPSYADKARETQGTQGKGTSTGSNAGGKTSGTNQRTPNANLEQFKKEMQQCNTLQSQIDKLFEWKAKEKEGCSCHPGLKHKFFNCFDVCRICDENGWMEALVEAKMRNDKRVTFSKGEELIKKLNDKVAAKKAAMHPTPGDANQSSPEDESSDESSSQNTDSTDE